MSGRAKIGRRRRRLWRFVSRLFGPPNGRHVMGASPPPPSETAADPPAPGASIRLIFADGSVVELPEGFAEERRARYLAHNVLEAGGRA